MFTLCLELSHRRSTNHYRCMWYSLSSLELFEVATLANIASYKLILASVASLQTAAVLLMLRSPSTLVPPAPLFKTR